MDNGFIRIPRSLLSSDAWRKGSDKQRVAMVTLCSVVAYTEHVFHSKYGDVKLECGQMVTSYRSLAECLGVGVRQVRTLLQLLKNEGIISIEAVQKEATQEATQQMTQYSILTINDLHESATQQATREVTQDIRRINNDIFLFKNISPSNNAREENSHKKSPLKTKKRFVKPTVEEVNEYLLEKGITAFTAEAFWNYYESVGWMVGPKKKMVSWKACVTTWMEKERKFKEETRNWQENKQSYGTSQRPINNNQGYAGSEQRQRQFREHIAAVLTEPADDTQFELPF